MRWTPDVSSGDWLHERVDDPWRGTIHDFAPRGFAAYARVLHPVWRDGETERVTWADVATAFGTTMHPLAQWHRLVHAEDPYATGRAVDADGRRYDAPQQGRLDAETLATVVGHGIAHTAAPDDAGIAIWEGWGGVLGFYGETPARTILTAAFDDADAADVEYVSIRARHQAMLERSIPDPFNNVFRKPTWQPGILADEVSRGARLSLPGRDHVLFRGALAELADPAWPERVPWTDRDAPQWTASPSIVWPDDRAWVLVTEVDVDSTIVGGSAELVDALLNDPRIEALPLPPDASLSWDADRVNA